MWRASEPRNGADMESEEGDPFLTPSDPGIQQKHYTYRTNIQLAKTGKYY